MMDFTRLLPLFFATSLVTFAGVQAQIVDRTTCFLPPGSDAAVVEPLSKNARTPDELFPNASPAWQNYLRLWKSIRSDPSNESLSRYLGLTNKKSADRRSGGDEDKFSSVRIVRGPSVRIVRGRSAPRWLQWRAGSYQQVETSHFTIYSRADRALSTEVAQALEDCYWVWTQMFFPLWEAAPQVTGHLKSIQADQSVADFISKSSKRITIRRRLTIVLFSDAQQYVTTLGKNNSDVSQSALAQSTGFYSDDRRTTFLIGKPLDLPTLRHELVHQLFCEATRSGLENGSGEGSIPGAQRDFWLVEGIAGYFESMSEGELASGRAGRTATLGGWDSPRLQFARYRALSGGDEMPMEELRRDGRLSAQSRTDLPRWYAHAIARTHQALDGGDTKSREWIYRKLSELYKVDSGLDSTTESDQTGMPLRDNSLSEFLKVNDDDLRSNPPTRPLTSLCLTRCDVTAAGLASLPVSADLRWLDLTGLPIASSDLTRLIPQPDSLQQLSLEATRVDDNLGTWMKQAKSLREVDLSWTQISDAVIESLASARSLSTLWVTGSRVTDASVGTITEMKSLSSVDVQRTKITESGLLRLKTDRPGLTVNPLQLISQ